MTVLFADIVGPGVPTVGERDPSAELGARRELLHQTVATAGGETLPWLGSGIMAAFPSTANAVRCAIAIQQRATRRDEHPIVVRVGLNVGEVVRDEAGTTYFGSPVVTAKRLCDRAEPGTILCTATVAGLLSGRHGLRFADAGVAELKGLPAPVAICQVLWNGEDVAPAGAAGGRAERMPLPSLLRQTEQFPFSGRDRELATLTDAWRATAEGRRVVLVEGEPGIGKTRLVTETARAVHAAGGSVLFGRCDEEMGVPFQPFVEALEHFLAHQPDDQLRQRLGKHAGELVRLVPDLAHRVPGLLPPLQSDAETERYRLFDAVASWLTAASADQQLFLVIDDLHWAGKPTLLLLRHVVRATASARLCLLGTHRDTEITPGHPLAELLADLRSEPGVERLPLGGLDEAGVVEFLQRASGRSLDATGIGVARTVHAETAGNPFFVGEVLRHLAEAGQLVQHDGRWVAAVAPAELGIPAAVRDVVLRRVGRLPPSAGEVLLLAAVIGRDFDLGVLATVSPLTEDEVLAAIDGATTARLVDETGIDGYRFAHALVRSALYRTIGASRRTRLHRRVAEAIERRRPDDVTSLAYHFGEAGEDQRPRAVHYAARAGDQAMQRLAHDQAIYFYERALELAKGLRPDDPSVRCELLASLGEAQRNAGVPEYRASLLEAAHLAENIGDTPRLVRAALANNRGWASTAGAVDRDRVAVLEAALRSLDPDDSPERASLLALLAAEVLYAGDRDRRIRLSDEALAMARRVGEPATLAHVLNVRGHTIWEPSTLTERLANTAEHLALAERLPDPRARWYALATRPQPCMEAGDVDEVDRCLEALWQLTSELAQPHFVWAATLDRAWRTMLDGDLVRTEELANQAFQVGSSAGQADAFTFFAAQLMAIRWTQGRLGDLTPVLEQAVAENPGVPTFRALLALAYVDDGRPADAHPLLVAAAADRFVELPVDMVWTSGITAWAEVAARVGARAAAETLFDLVTPWTSMVVFNGIYVLGSVARSAALLAETLGRPADADRLFADALAQHERMRAPALVARTQLDWGTTLLARGDTADGERGRALLAHAHDAATALGLSGIARRARLEAGR